MKFDNLKSEINFGLENLERIHQTIQDFERKEIDQQVKTSALTYECFGYYNAIEHLIIRFIKHLNLTTPSGQFSHRDILKVFKNYLVESKIDFDTAVMTSIENLMAFRHVASKIYSFLIDGEKLDVIIQLIKSKHFEIRRLFLDILGSIQSRQKDG